MRRIIQPLMILIIILLFFQLTPIIIWILKLILALGFVDLAYEEYKNKSLGRVILYAMLALLFQPFMNLGIGQAAWIVIKVLVLIWLIKLIFGSKEDF